MKPFIVMDIVQEAEKYEDVIHFEIGQPDIEPSENIKQSAINSIHNNQFFYTQSKGLLKLRQKIALHYKKFYNIDINPENIIITTGSSTAFLIAFHFANTIATPTPGYPCYENFAILENKKFIKIPTTFPDYSININLLNNYKFDTLMFSSPNNPTGTIIENLEQICDATKDKIIISDELYHGLIYDKNYTSALKYRKDAIIINGFSKFFCMPGFRIGWIILPDDKIRQAEIVAQNILISAPTISQYSALNGFDYKYLSKITKEFKIRRDFLYNELKDIFPIAEPDGAFYLWCDIGKYSNNSFKFAMDLLKTKQVAVTPGIDFGDYPNFIRLSYTQPLNKLKEGAKRIKEFLG